MTTADSEVRSPHVLSDDDIRSHRPSSSDVALGSETKNQPSQDASSDSRPAIVTPTKGDVGEEDNTTPKGPEEDRLDADLFWRRHVRRPFSSKKFLDEILEAKFPLLRNDEGALMHFGDEWAQFMYCGRRLGKEAIPGSDGQCGPSNGPHCDSCNRLQTNSRMKILKLLFPAQSQRGLIAALRIRGGNAYSAYLYLAESLGILPVLMEVAFPGTRHELLPEPRYHVSKTDVICVVEFLDYCIDSETAEMALRRNEHNVEKAITFLLEESPENVMAATLEDAKEAKAYARAVEEFRCNRQAALLDSENNPDPVPEVDNLVKSMVSFKPELSAEAARSQGHGMTLPDKENGESICCSMCASTIGSIYAGNQYCQQCQLCDGCIQAKTVFMCPKMRNGGHLHGCPLQTMKIGKARLGYICDIEGEGCLGTKNHNLPFFCPQCNFDVCAVCISKPSPINYHRRFGEVFEIVEDEDEREEEVEIEEADTMETPRVEEAVVVEDEFVQREEGPTNPAEPSPAEAIDSNEIENASSGLSFDQHERMAASEWEGNLGRQSSLATIVIGTGNVRTTSRRPNEAPEQHATPLRHNRPASLLKPKFTSAIDTYIKKESPAASEVHHVEDLLHLAQGNEKSLNSDMICQAVQSGKTGIAGTYVLAQSYGPKRKQESRLTCFCGDAIDSATAPDGAVGCLNGHGMHPSCAADHLLGGGDCPTCREPLFFPEVSKSEATAAEAFLEGELCRRRKEEKDALQKQNASQGQILSVNDIVQISADEELCKQHLMACPDKTGWASEMKHVCGAIGRITKIEENSVEVHTQKLDHIYFSSDVKMLCSDGHDMKKGGQLCVFCYKCTSCCASEGPSCSQSTTKFRWTPSTLTLIGRASSASLWDKSLVDKDFAMAAAAEQHIIRLRAELNAVTTARSNIQESFSTCLVSEEMKALNGLVDEVSVPDIHRAKHMLLLMEAWDDSSASVAEKKLAIDLIRTGDIDSAARRIRHYNAVKTGESTKWRDVESGQHEYVIEDYATVDLLAWASLEAPRTGYCLTPKTRFWSKVEFLDKEGNVWLQVDETKFRFSESQNGKIVVASQDYSYEARKLIGCRVSPVPGGPTSNGKLAIINKVTNASIYVKWLESGSESWYNISKPIFVFANPPSPQGWLCMNQKEISVARRGRSALRCFGCGDGLVPEVTRSEELIRPVQENDTVTIGDTFMVAATLEPVQVVGVEKDLLRCKFPSGDESLYISYQRKDLIRPSSDMTPGKDLVLVDSEWKSRLEIFMKKGDEARTAWEDCKVDEPYEPSVSKFASCVKGHLLHARCFQEALLGGKCCPVVGCNEPLWVPKVRRLKSDVDTCCDDGETTGNDGETIELAGAEAVARAREEHGDVTYPIELELKMCPSCCSGPLFNQNCNDMKAHHGQCVHHAFGNDGESPCYYCADVNDIASSLLQLSDDKKVVDVLPKCPTHNSVIMFCGCMVCGQLFTDSSWSDLPKWDATAKTMLHLDQQKRKAAASLVREITREVALLGFERDALSNKWDSSYSIDGSSGLLPPLPPVAMRFYPSDDSDSDSSDNDGDY